MSKTPPVPPANRSDKGPGSDPSDAPSDIAHKPDPRERHLEQQGRQGNTSQNTHHQGYQQDR